MITRPNRDVLRKLAIGVAFLAMGLLYAYKHDMLRRPVFSAVFHDVVRFVTAGQYVPEEGDAPITCWGDSLTSGYRDTLRHDFPSLLTYLYHRPTVNRGVPSETSGDIKSRMLRRSKPSREETVVIWAGRNNADLPEQIKSDIQEMVASLNPGSKYLVIGIINADEPEERKGQEEYNKIIQLNKDLALIYKARFVPIREILISNANRRFAADIENLDQDVVPSSLRFDELHLNDLGQAIVANSVERALVANGW